MGKFSSISLVLPCYNEGKNLPFIVPYVSKMLNIIADKYEIIIVDDGSTDNSSVLAANFEFEHIRIIRHTQRLGHGAAIWSGIKTARYDHISYIDSDLQYDIADISRLLNDADKYSIILGYRGPRMDSVRRKIGSYCWKCFIDFFFNLKVRDINCGFKVFRKSVFAYINVQSYGAFFNTELLLRAQHYGYQFCEIPVAHYPRTHGKSTGGNISVWVRAVLEAFRFKYSWHDQICH